MLSLIKKSLPFSRIIAIDEKKCNKIHLEFCQVTLAFCKMHVPCGFFKRIHSLKSQIPPDTGGIYGIYAIFAFSKIFTRTKLIIMPATPCTAFAGIFTADGTNPYIKPSNTKYPRTITASATTPPTILEGALPILLCIALKQK